jgi:hypothetical protein
MTAPKDFKMQDFVRRSTIPVSMNLSTNRRTFRP